MGGGVKLFVATLSSPEAPMTLGDVRRVGWGTACAAETGVSAKRQNRIAQVFASQNGRMLSNKASNETGYGCSTL